MGKGIIFVGGGNLNRNKDQQSMYSAGKRTQYNKQKNMREKFYKELCTESRKLPMTKARKKKIQQLKSTYESYACSEKNMEKVFISYFECFQKPIKKGEYKAKLLNLPQFLEKNKVDKRIIKRIKEVEKIKDINKTIKIKNKEKKLIDRKNLVDRKKNQLNRFHKLLNQYLIESSYDSNVAMNSELEDLFLVFKRHPDYIDQLKIIYQQMLNGEDVFNNKRKKRKYSIPITDQRGLLKHFHLYKKMKI